MDASLQASSAAPAAYVVDVADRVPRRAVSMISPLTLAQLAQALGRMIIGFYVTHFGVQTM